jgi:hypothetical protein
MYAAAKGRESMVGELLRAGCSAAEVRLLRFFTEVQLACLLRCAGCGGCAGCLGRTGMRYALCGMGYAVCGVVYGIWGCVVCGLLCEAGWLLLRTGCAGRGRFAACTMAV